MKNSCVNWYKSCINSLFGNETDNWLYRILKEFSTMCRLEESEEIIKDTKFRYRALLDTSLDVFTGDRMGNKSYQLPFAMYYVAKTMFKEPVAAIASEALMTVGNWDYRVRSNLLKFILFDDNPAERFLEKMTIFFMSLEECRRLEDVYMADCKDIPFAEYYPELLKEMADVDYEQIRGVLQRIRKAPEQYYHIYDNVLWRACEIRVPEEMRQMYRRQVKIKSKYSVAGMERDLEDFVKKDMYDYINKGYVASYNPFWLFGSSGYKDNIDFIFQRKHIVEFDVVWIQYLFLKARNGGFWMSNFDVYECIRNKEIREFFRSKGLSVWEQIQVIVHSYASMQKKREWLACLLQQVAEDEKQQVSNMMELIDTCLYQIYQTKENVLYIAERRFTSMERRKWGDEDIECSSPDGAELTFHDEVVKMTEYLSRTYALEPDENNEEIYVYQIIKAPHKKHRIKLEFSMTWMDDKLEIFQIFPDKEWLERKGIPEETVDDFEDVGVEYKELPFKQGDRLKIKTPLMQDYIYGTLTFAEYDGCGCWYYFFTPDGKEMDIDTEKYAEDMIDLSHHEIDLTMGYTVFDWVERE